MALQFNNANVHLRGAFSEHFQNINLPRWCLFAQTARGTMTSENIHSLK